VRLLKANIKSNTSVIGHSKDRQNFYFPKEKTPQQGIKGFTPITKPYKIFFQEPYLLIYKIFYISQRSKSYQWTLELHGNPIFKGIKKKVQAYVIKTANTRSNMLFFQLSQARSRETFISVLTGRQA